MPEFNDYYNNRVDLDMQVTGVSVLGIVPFNDMFEIYLRLGAGFWDGESTQRLDQSFGDAMVTRSISDDGTGLLLGVGFGLNLSRSLQVRFDLQTVGIDEDVLNAQEDTSLDSFLFEVQYRFGAN
jgi:opacity protein-like surface antigen